MVFSLQTIRTPRRLTDAFTTQQLTGVVKELDAADSGKGKEGEGLLARLTAKFDAARAYSTDKIRLGFVESLFGQAEGTLLLVLGMMYVQLTGLFCMMIRAFIPSPPFPTGRGSGTTVPNWQGDGARATTSTSSHSSFSA